MRKEKKKQAAKQITIEEKRPIAPVKQFKLTDKAIAFILFAFAFLLYAPSLTYDFTYDDSIVIKKNELVTKGFAGIKEIVTHGSIYGFNQNNEGAYRPLPVALNAVLWQFFPDNPLPGHLLNVILYALICSMLFIFCRRIAPQFSVYWAFGLALLFAAHPLHTEVVANNKSLDELLTVFFLLCSGLLMLSSKKNYSIVKTISYSFLFLLALLCKETAVTFVLILPMLFYFLQDEDIKTAIKRIFILLIPAAIYFLLRYLILDDFFSSKPPDILDSTLIAASNFAEKSATAFAIIGRYIKLLFIPWPLSYDYSFSEIDIVNWSSPSAFIPALLIFGGLIWSLMKLKTRSFVAMTILFFIISISIVSNLVVDIASTMAERFLFVSSIAWSMFAAWLLSGTFRKTTIEKNTSSALRFAGIALIIIFVILTEVRLPVWRDDFSLYESGAISAPNSARTQCLYGGELIRKAMEEQDPSARTNYLNDAVEHLERSVAIYPAYVNANENAGHAWFELGNYPKAISYLLQGLKNNPKHYPSLFFAGVCYEKLGKLDSAEIMNERALKVDSLSKDARTQQAFLLLRHSETTTADSAGRYLATAAEKFNVLATRYPDNYDIYYYRGIVLLRLNNLNEATTSFKKATEINSNRPDAYEMLGTISGMQGSYQESVNYLLKAIQQNSRSVDTYRNIVISYIKMNDTAKAKEALQKGLALIPQDPMLLQLKKNLGL